DDWIVNKVEEAEYQHLRRTGEMLDQLAKCRSKGIFHPEYLRKVAGPSQAQAHLLPPGSCNPHLQNVDETQVLVPDTLILPCTFWLQVLATDKDAPSFTKSKLNSRPSDPLSTEMSRDAPVSPMANRQVSPQASGIFKMAQMARAHNAQLLKLSKDIPPMIQKAIKMAMQPVVDKLGSLCARVDMLEEEVAAKREDLDRRKDRSPPIDMNLKITAAGSALPVENRSQPDDWYVEYSPSEVAEARERKEVVPPCNEVPLLLLLVTMVIRIGFH
ncbi:hypothetical protein HAX54_044045, partial [Datura stramonium]|nr:hypothetical protein [Datura stramonium]